MFDFMFALPEWAVLIVCVLLIGLVSAASAVLMWLFRLAWPNRQNATIVSTMLSGILLPVGLVIAFVASDVWQQDARGRIAVEQEAVAVADTIRIAQHLPDDLRKQVLELTDDYVREIVEVEWPLMAEGLASQKAELLLGSLERVSILIEIAAQDSSLDQARLLHTSDDLLRYTRQIEGARNQRLLVSNSRVMSTKWVAVYLLLLVVACVICELHAKQRRAMTLALMLFSIGFGATLYVVVSYDRPFTGVTSIGPRPLHLMLTRG